MLTRIRDSDRHRPPALANETRSRAEPVELMGRTLAPETVADPEPVAVQVTLNVPVAVTGAALFAG